MGRSWPDSGIDHKNFIRKFSYLAAHLMLNIAVKILLYKIYNLMTSSQTLFTKSSIIIYGWVDQDTHFRDCVYFSDIKISGNLGHVYHLKDFQNQPILGRLSVVS